jgi:hypothetical protein
MGKPDEAQKNWLQKLSTMGGGGRAIPALSVPPAREPDRPAGPMAEVMGEQSVVRADGAKGTLKLPGEGKPAVNGFVPKLEIIGGPTRELAIAGKVTLELKVSNWDKRPNGTKLDWSVTGTVKVVDFTYEKFDGGGTLTVTGLAAGKAVVKIEVKVAGGGTFLFPYAVFTVHPTAKDATMWVPRLDAPRTVNSEIAVGEKVALYLKVANWDQRPKGTVLSWGASTSVKAVDIELEHREGEGTITVKGLEVGKGVVKANVTVQGGGTYAFWDTEFNVINDADPHRSVDKGGAAEITNLEQDMRNIVQDWRSAAHIGISQFVTNELSKRIDKLESGSTKNFLFALLGNVVWAAACFTTGGAAFAISLTGIAIGAVPAIPEKSKSFIPDIQKMMENYIDGIGSQWDNGLRTKAKALLDKNPGITRFHALNEFVAASFKADFIKLNPRHTTIPTLNKPAMRDVYERDATRALDSAIKADEAIKAEKRKKDAAENRVQRSRRI